MADKLTHSLIAIDLDGTLLSSSHELSEENIRAVGQARARGLDIVLASARPLFGMQIFLEKLGLDGPVITYNGAFVLDIKSGRVQIDRPIARLDTLSVIQIVRDLGLYVGYYSGIDWYVDKECDEMYWEFSAQKRPPIITDLTQDSVPPAHKLIVADLSNPERLSHGYDIISNALPDLNVHFSGRHSFEVTHYAASKGNALAHLAREIGIAPDRIVAIGDNFNDMDMFTLAGTSVAMGNAPAEVKAVADWIVASNDEHGVAQAIRRVLDDRN
jgi:Cof subfamily protein (haloacid dehalogenase superfamily)